MLSLKSEKQKLTPQKNTAEIQRQQTKNTYIFSFYVQLVLGDKLLNHLGRRKRTAYNARV